MEKWRGHEEDQRDKLTEQKDCPRLHREGSRALMLPRLMLFSEQRHSPSPSQIPLVWPRVTQEAEHAHDPRLHLGRRRGEAVEDRGGHGHHDDQEGRGFKWCGLG